MTAVLYTPHFVQFLDEDGNPLSGGKLYTYAAGTSTPKATFTTAAGDIPNANPIILDAAGRTVLFLQGAYKFRLETAQDELVRETDSITAFTTTAAAADSFFQTFSGDGTQTAFTLSEDLGTDEKTIMVFINDASGDVGFDIQAPTDYTLNDTSLTFAAAPVSGTNNIQVWAPGRLANAAAASAAAADTSATAAAASATAASNSATAAQTSETNAETAETGAVAAQEAAEDARDTAVAAAGTASVGNLNDLSTEISLELADFIPFVDTSDSNLAKKITLANTIASEAEAEAGTATDKLMTPERTKQAIAADPFLAVGIGQYVEVQDNMTGAQVPDNSSPYYKFIKLTANQTGVGEYNEGLLTSQSISGSAPLVQATAEIVGGPMNGQTVRLINTENRYLMPGTSAGTVANDQMQKITGAFKTTTNLSAATEGGLVYDGTSYANTGGAGNIGSSANRKLQLDSSASPGARTGTSTNVKHIQVTFYMRVQ